MVKIPPETEVVVEGNKVSVKGKEGKLERKFSVKGVRIEKKGDEVVVSCDDSMLANTIEAHITNMLRGASEGFHCSMKAVYSHFPISFEVKGRQLMIKNFLGEKNPRVAEIIGDTKIEVKGQDVSLSGSSKEDVGQTIANIKQATRISKRDSRVFQDGLYVVES
ncbi:MAG: 50S ribosomal protein L6 [Candidatus Micrarchaeota archaeon]